MKKNLVVFSICLLFSFLFVGCEKKDIEANVGAGNIVENNNTDYRVENQQLLLDNLVSDNLDIEETDVHIAAEILHEIGVGQLLEVSIEELKSDDKASSIFLVNKEGKIFYMTMDNRGNVGYIKTEHDEYLHMNTD